jgi:hypothetical protein
MKVESTLIEGWVIGPWARRMTLLRPKPFNQLPQGAHELGPDQQLAEMFGTRGRGNSGSLALGELPLRGWTVPPCAERAQASLETLCIDVVLLKVSTQRLLAEQACDQLAEQVVSVVRRKRGRR